MKKLASIVFFMIFLVSFCLTVVSGDAYADAPTNYNDCINDTPYGYISSVQWQCSGWAEEGIQHCSAWLGAGNGHTSLYASGTSGTMTAYYWGMCTSGQAGTSALWVDYDNGAVDDSHSLYRGPWGSPNYVSTTVDIAKLISGISPYQDGNYLVYKRSIYVGRCHAENTSSCSGLWQDIYVYVEAPSTTFDGSVSLTSAPSGATQKSDGKYYTDSDSTSFTFTDYMWRNNNGRGDNVYNSWWLYQDGSYYESSGMWFAKNSGSKTIKTHARTVNLNQGDQTFCEKLGFNSVVSYSGSGSSWAERQACVTIHRYIWYSWDGQVIPSASGASGADSGGILYVDGNTAEMSFSHQLKKNGGSVKTRYKTSRSNTPSTFPQQTNYTNIGLSSNNTFTEIYRSPSSGTKTVNVAKDNGTEYCQTLNWYQYTREDRGDSDTGTSKIKTEKTASGCKTIRRYKTTFSGTIKVEYQVPGTSTWTTIYSAGSSEILPTSSTFQSIPITGENIPIGVKVRFTHTITRSNSDAHGSPNKKKSYFITNITGTTGYRSGDPHGTAVTTAKATKDLGSGESDTHVDEFTVKIYPEQEITLCQHLTYKSEIQGADDTATATAGKRCFKFTKTQVSCQGVNYGIKNAKNYLQMEIYKNGSRNQNSGRLDTTKSDEMVTWTKPGDSIRFKYTMCAAGELASQFADKYITTYSVNTSQAGYLFGKSLSDAPNYDATSKTVGTSSTTPGEGPFPNGTAESHKYEYTTASPSDAAGGMYKCAGSGLDNYYRIPDIHSNAPATDSDYSSKRGNCKSDDYGNISDVGRTFTQTATWSDIWYENGTAVRGHTGGNATVVGRINTPYNYLTSVQVTGTGGNVVLGQNVSTQVQIRISPRTNTPVQSTSYATYSKPTRFRLVQVTISANSTLSAATYNNAIKAQEYSLTDGSGSLNLASSLSYCGNRTYGVTCAVVRNQEGRFYESGNAFQTIPESSYSINIPDSNSGTYQVGTKICFVAGIWPSDSHGFADESTEIDSTNQGEALKDGGSRWHISKPSCYSVVKRPTMSALGGDLYAPGGIKGITTKRDKNGGGKGLFGTWSEYGLISGTSKNASAGKIEGVASGASLWGGGAVSEVTRECYFSSMTFANSKCGATTSELGKVPIDTSVASYPERLADQIRTRYTDSSNAAAKTDAYKINDAGGCVYDARSNTYVENRTDPNSRFICLPGGAKYMHATANVSYIESNTNYCMIKGDTNNSRTAVIESDNTLVIGTNNVYGNNRDTGHGKIPGTGCYREFYSNISEIPQSIYIAKTIILKDTVERMESWLIADEIYTCDPRSGYKAANDPSNPLTKNTINSGNCNKQLVVNGPVITKKLHLFRTGGGDGSSNNALASEIFYLGPEAYLWSYNQAQRFSQATTTYQREVAPRY